MTKKIIKKWGDSMVIVFNKEDQAIMNLEVGDVVIFQLKHLKKRQDGR